MRKKQKPFEMKNLLSVKKTSLNLEPFEDSKIRRDMLSGDLKRGEQIWIYHDSETNPCNPVACLNKYAHCVIYAYLLFVTDTTDGVCVKKNCPV